MKGKTFTAAFVMLGFLASFGYAAIAQQPQQQTPMEQHQDSPNPTTIEQNRESQNSSPIDQNRESQNPTTTEQNRANASQSDRDFMVRAAQGNMAEIRLSQLALQRASSDEVKNYAQQMIQEHTQANRQLMTIASRKGVTLPTNIDAQHRQIEAQLRQLSGARFDQAYMRAMESDHAATVALFQRQTQQGRDRDVTAFATTLLPRIQQHYTMASNMVRELAARSQR